jgi:lauroyl/myristoyl acyltransferase
MKAYEKALLDNRLLIVSLDQSYTNRGVGLMFFNRPLACAKGAAILHQRTGAPVFTSVYYMKDGELHIDFDEVELPSYANIDDASIADISSCCLRLYEPFIRAYPEQWFSLFHRLWGKKDYPPVKRSLAQIF